jgi:hypothetical protein
LPVLFRWRTGRVAAQRFSFLCRLNLEATRPI